MILFAKIKIWNETVGSAIWNEQTQTATFEYDAKFVSKAWDLSPVKMPLQAGKVYSFQELNRKTYNGLPGLLADSLPDKFGNTLINKWLSEQGRDPDTYNPIERLLYQGKRSMGALEFEPEERTFTNIATKIELETLVEAARKVMSEKETLKASFDNEDEIREIIRVGTSAGGARAKAVIAYNEQTGEIRSGQASAPEGFTHYLLKLDGVTNLELGDPEHFGQIEYAYYQMVIESGIEMSESRLLREGNRCHFLTKRFDRVGGSEKLHLQTLCGLAHFDFNLPGAYSYEQLFQTMRTLRLPYTDAEQVYRRMIFNVVARNQDDHTKNFSFLMNKNGVWRLAPAYDMTFAYNPFGTYTTQHQMSLAGKRDNFTRKDLLQVAENMNIKKPNEKIDEVISAVAQWNVFAKEVNIPQKQIDYIAKTHRLDLHK
ncbi:MAG: type II toxin-antitoxin system HipA family toxin [Prevotellaceae bacterium]|jgi:serine/threonine-protein kinase HipA|nr:type II toxin-antitoxin system HipA family toxin [Prevotellaceae bacterium]